VVKKVTIFLSVILLSAFICLGSTGCETEENIEEKFDRSEVSILSKDKLIVVGDVLWEILEVEDMGSSIIFEGIECYKTPGRLIKVKFSIENTGQEEMFISYIDIIDDKGRDFPVCIEIYGCVQGYEECILEDIFPGVKKTFTTIFDVPIDSVDLILEVHDLHPGITGKKVYVDLGV